MISLPESPPRRRLLAWTVPAVVAVAVVGSALALTSASSSAAPSLAGRTVAQLLTDVQTHAATPFSGEVHESAALGLPNLPGEQSTTSFSWQSLLTGSHDIRVWSDGPQRQRIALIGQLSEADIVHNGNTVWTYTSDTNTVTRTTLPDRPARHEHRSDTPTERYSPAGVARRILAAVSPSTSVTVGTTQSVAGRDAYTIVVAPKDQNSTVRHVDIAVDSSTYVPLRVAIYGSGSTPAFQIGFSTISFHRPAASTFAFHAPKGATVSNDPFAGRHDRHGWHGKGPHGPRQSPPPGAGRGVPATTHARPRIIGSDWTSVVELPAGSAGSLSGMLREASTPVGSSGARLLHTSLINVELMPDGRVFAGAVTPAFLEHVAATTP